MKSFIVPLVIFASIVALILVGGAGQNGDIDRTAQQVQGTVNTATSSGLLPCFGIGFLVVVFVLASLPAFTNKTTTHHTSVDDIDRALVQVTENDYDPEVERDTFTNEEIGLPGIDIRNSSHREHIKDLRYEQKYGRMNRKQQERREKLEKRTVPDSRYAGGYTKRDFTEQDTLEIMREKFPRANVRYSGNIFGNKDMEFSMRGKNTLEMSVSRSGQYRIVEVVWNKNTGHSASVERYTGNAKGAFNNIQSWYQGG
jgi:hypothetical protein